MTINKPLHVAPLVSETCGVPIRKFRSQPSTTMVQDALTKAGYHLKARQYQKFDVLPDKPGLKRYLNIGLGQLMNLVDRLRREVGLEPIVKRT